MRIKEGFVCRAICGENVVSGEGLTQVDFTKLIRLNDTAAYLWHAVEGQDFTEETLAELLCKEYDVDRQTALDDAARLCRLWIEQGLVSND